MKHQDYKYMATTINDIPDDIRDGNDLVFHDGVPIPIDKLTGMAKKAGIHLMEHYINSILAHALLCNKPELMSYCNEIREYYKLARYATPDVTPSSSQNMPNKIEDEIRKRFKSMSTAERQNFISECLSILFIEQKELFKRKICWIGIFLVVKDRLDGKMKQGKFFTFIEKATPKEWPVNLRLIKSTMRNFSRYIKAEYADEAYYDMREGNPWNELCDAFWEIIQRVFLMNK